MAETDATYGGGCQCGAIRYRLTGRPLWTAFCHCQSCRRATGSAVAAYAGYAADRFAYVAGAPRRHGSSSGVTRGFCGACGSPLTYEGERWPGEIHIHIGTLDQPEAFPPEGHAFAAERLPWLHFADDAQDDAGDTGS
ncbi:MAG: GFA family protein [Alphaproteobacteria bacterium]